MKLQGNQMVSGYRAYMATCFYFLAFGNLAQKALALRLGQFDETDVAIWTDVLISCLANYS